MAATLRTLDTFRTRDALRTLRSAFLILCAAAVLAACETDTSPAPAGNNPPPAPTHTSPHLRHGPNTGVRGVSGEISEEEAAKLGVDLKKEEEADEETETDGDAAPDSE